MSLEGVLSELWQDCGCGEAARRSWAAVTGCPPRTRWEYLGRPLYDGPVDAAFADRVAQLVQDGTRFAVALDYDSGTLDIEHDATFVFEPAMGAVMTLQAYKWSTRKFVPPGIYNIPPAAFVDAVRALTTAGQFMDAFCVLTPCIEPDCGDVQRRRKYIRTYIASSGMHHVPANAVHYALMPLPALARTPAN